MEFIKPFRQLSRTDVGIAGGKGASLGEMTRAKIPVPPGFVVLAAAFDRFLEDSDVGDEIEAIQHTIKYRDLNAVDRAANEIRALILGARFPPDLARTVQRAFTTLKSPLVAVRSSATAEDSLVASWAGELESYLNTTRASLLANIQRCWASLFTPRAIFYRHEKKLHKAQVSVAVVVQAMVQAEVSGICFTVHPVTKDYGQMVIEAGWGLGEAIVGGRITPDTYVVHKPRGVLLDKNISHQTMMIARGPAGSVEKSVPAARRGRQKLSDDEIIALFKLCQKVERHYGRPQDIEWALRRGKFFLLQARPITTLSRG